jgi:hypothetical protein
MAVAGEKENGRRDENLNLTNTTKNRWKCTKIIGIFAVSPKK